MWVGFSDSLFGHPDSVVEYIKHRKNKRVGSKSIEFSFGHVWIIVEYTRRKHLDGWLWSGEGKINHSWRHGRLLTITTEQYLFCVM